VTLTSKGDYDIFITKLDSSGKVLWATRAGGTDADSGGEISVDNTGASYITGTFTSQASFGNKTTSVTGMNAYVAKLDSNGEFIWVASGDTSMSFGYGLAVDSVGNSYVTGKFWGTAIFGNTTLVSWDNNMFIAKVNPKGQFVWATAAPGVSEGNGIAADSMGNVYVTGGFLGTASFGTLSVDSKSIFSDIYVTKLGKQ
jgi:hypothetical protein